MVLRNFTDIVQMGSTSSSFQTSDVVSEGDFRPETRPGKLFSTAPEPIPDRRRQRIILSPGLRSAPAPVYVVSNAAPWLPARGMTLSDDASPVTPVMPQCAAVAPDMVVGSRRVLSCTVLPAREVQAAGEAFCPYDPFAPRVQRTTSKGNYHMAWLRSMARWELDSIDRIIASYGEEPAVSRCDSFHTRHESCLHPTTHWSHVSRREEENLKGKLRSLRTQCVILVSSRCLRRLGCRFFGLWTTDDLLCRGVWN